jgi:hypothetical protein
MIAVVDRGVKEDTAAFVGARRIQVREREHAFTSTRVRVYSPAKGKKAKCPMRSSPGI